MFDNQDPIMKKYARVMAKVYTGRLDRNFALKSMKWIVFCSKTEPDGSNPEADKVIRHLLHNKPLPLYIKEGIQKMNIEDDNEVEAKDWEERMKTMQN